MLLIRPIITYAAPIWWNTNHTSMEKLRILERKCLRACLRLYRSQSSNGQQFISNQYIYEQAEIPRIDQFIIKLTRDYFCKLPNIDNNVINAFSYRNVSISKRQLTIGYTTPQAFIYCDQNGLIQNDQNIPLCITVDVTEPINELRWYQLILILIKKNLNFRQCCQEKTASISID